MLLQAELVALNVIHDVVAFAALFDETDFLGPETAPSGNSALPVMLRRVYTSDVVSNLRSLIVPGLLVMSLSACSDSSTGAKPSTSMSASTTAPSTASSTPVSTDVATTTSTTIPSDRLAAWPEPTDSLPLDEIPFLLPGAQVASAGDPVRSAFDGGSAAPATFTQVFADSERDMVLTLQTQPGGVESTPNDLRQPVTIAGWDDAFLTVGGLRLVASEPGGFVRLAGTGIDSDQAVSILTSMRRRARGTAGWDLSEAWNDLVEINGAWEDSAGQRSITWFDGDRVVAQMLSSPASTHLIAQALGASFQRVDVNGTHGWLNSTDSRRSIVWANPDGTVVVLGTVDSSIDPLVLARSVQVLDRAAYEAATTTQVPAGVGDGCDGSLFC
ncbi:MAG: hypothetical protein Q7V57_01770 [Actinomycetota bacterium]|nr:hypothetical protein [Actinomycetota bacterium]